MALYELCTNAMKYGALAEGKGPVLLTWKIEGGNVVLEWEEKTTADPRHGVGFGATLIRVALAEEPQARVNYRVEPDGVHASFQWRALAQADYRDAAARNGTPLGDDQAQEPRHLFQRATA
jgi:two-component sensor histidine kinase